MCTSSISTRAEETIDQASCAAEVDDMRRRLKIDYTGAYRRVWRTMSEDICYGFCSLLTSISKILQYNLRSFIYTQGGVSMKRTVLLVFLSTLFLFTAVFSASAASGGEVAVSWVDSNWAIEGGLC